jgi:hypothetical protein
MLNRIRTAQLPQESTYPRPGRHATIPQPRTAEPPMAAKDLIILSRAYQR